MKFFKRIFKYLGTFLVIISLFIISYFYAYKKAKSDIVNFLYKRWGNKVKIEGYSLNIFKGLKFEKIVVEDVFLIKNLRLNYDFISLFMKKSIENLSCDTFIFNQKIFSKEEKDKEKKEFLLPSFFIENFKIDFLEFKDKDKSYKFKKINGFIKFSKKMSFLSFLELYSFYPYSFYLKVVIDGDLKKQSFKIIDLENEIFKTQGEIEIYYPFIELKFKSIKIYDFLFKDFEGKIKIKDDDIDIVYFEGKEKRGEISFSGRIKNFKDLNKIYVEVASFIKGSYGFKGHLFNFEIINEFKITKNFLKSEIYFDNLDFDNFKKINGFSKFTLFFKERKAEIETLNLKYKGMEIYAKGLYPEKLKFNIKLDKENDLPYLAKSYGEIFGIYEKKDKEYVFVAYGNLREFKYKNFLIPKIEFTIGRKNLNEDFITFNLDSLYYKNFFIGEMNLNLKRKDTLFFIKASIHTPFAGNFETNGTLFKGKNYYLFSDSLNKINVKLKENVIEATFKEIEIFNGFINSNIYFDIKNNSFELILDSRNLNIENLRLRENLWISGIFNLNLKFEGNKDKFDFTFYSKPYNFKLNDIEISDFFISAKGNQNKIELNINGNAGGGELKINGFVYNLKNYEFEIVTNRIEILKIQKILNFKFIEFNKGFISSNIRINKEGIKGDLLLENCEGEIVYTLSPFHKSFLFLNIDNEKVKGKINGYSKEGEFRGYLEGNLKGYKFSNFKISLNLKRVPLIYEFVEGKTSGKFEILIEEDKIKLSSNLKIDEAFIVPVFKKEKPPSSPNKIFLDLLFTSNGKVFILNEWIDAEMKGEMRITKKDLINYYMEGELEILRGNIFYIGNVFEIKEGKMFLKGEKEFIPEISLRAEMPYVVQGENVKIILEIKNNLKEPDFKLYSEPISFDESTLIKALTLGEMGIKPFSEIGMRGIQVGEKIFSTKLRKEVRIAEFSLISGGTPSITFGTYVSPYLYIKYQHDFLSLYKDEFLIKYFLNPRFSLYSKRERKGEITTGLEFEIRF
jgi:hypothetical protein